MYQPRNPFAPLQNEVFTPQQFLSRYLAFYHWESENKYRHLSSCRLENRQIVRDNGFCCSEFLKSCMDAKLLELAGCRTGLWVEPEGFQNWLVLAWKRLEELENHQDFYPLWTKTLEEQSEELYYWVRNTVHGAGDQAFIPGFSLNSFMTACRKYDFQPDPNLLSICFD